MIRVLPWQYPYHGHGHKKASRPSLLFIYDYLDTLDERIICAHRVCASYANTLCAHHMRTLYVRIICEHSMCASYANTLCAHHMRTLYVRIICEHSMCASYAMNRFGLFSHISLNIFNLNNLSAIIRNIRLIILK
jgi:hypothetical protein